MIQLNRTLLFSLLFITPTLSYAKDSLETVLARMKPETAIAIAYQEKRSMGLLADDLNASGYFYVSPPETMLKEQLTPDAEIMGAVGKQLYYYKVDDKQRYQMQMNDSMPMNLHITAFNGLMNGDLAALESVYHIEFNTDDKQWTITLTAKDYDEEEEEQPLKVIMQGLAEKPANNLVIIEADGDSTELSLKPECTGKTAQELMNSKLKILTGQP
ncbi:MAG: hypothetical protein GQ569_12050 [Methylococcaceae bacterium]|nr:hypothetical protein [Methylococcaceae bacterium]